MRRQSRSRLLAISGALSADLDNLLWLSPLDLIASAILFLDSGHLSSSVKLDISLKLCVYTGKSHRINEEHISV